MAIKTGFMDPDPIISSYEKNDGHSTLFDILDQYSKSRGTGGIQTVNANSSDLVMKNLRAGDIIMIPLNKKAVLSNRMHHVAAVVELADTLCNVKVSLSV